MLAEETPLAWPATVALSDLRTCTTCALKISSPTPGTLKILTRRAGDGTGDGVNIEENTITTSVSYRGQTYSVEEAILHVAGLHVFPGQDKPFPAEYHIHMSADSSPKRYITIVFGVSHLVDPSGVGLDYFAATWSPSAVTGATATDATSVKPILSTLFTPGIQMIQYKGPDIRGRTAVHPAPTNPSTTEERQFLLMLKPLTIRASDLERIPREGSLSINPVDLPEIGVAPTKTVLRNRVIGQSVLATPGVATGDPIVPVLVDSAIVELECRPLATKEGKNYILYDASGTAPSEGFTDLREGFAAGDGSTDWNDFAIYAGASFLTLVALGQFFKLIVYPMIFDGKGQEYANDAWPWAYVFLLGLGSMIYSTYPGNLPF